MNVNIIQSSSAVHRTMAATAALRSNTTIIGLPFNCDFCHEMSRAVAAFTGLESVLIEVVTDCSITGAGGAAETALLQMLGVGGVEIPRAEGDAVFNPAHGCTSLTFIFSGSKASLISTTTIGSVSSTTVHPGVFAWRSVMSQA